MKAPQSQSKEFLEGWFRALTAVKDYMKDDMDLQKLWEAVMDARQEMYWNAHPDCKHVLLWE